MPWEETAGLPDWQQVVALPAPNQGGSDRNLVAMSSESKASAYIVGSLPFVVFTLVWFINPGYMSGFFVDQRLMVAGIGGLIWMSIGAFIMAKMVNFEI